MATTGTRGKWGERQVQAWMKKRSDADARFAFNRYPDARAGSLQSAPSDFEASSRGIHYKIEVKEVTLPEGRKSRLIPEKNFSADKVARMFKWQLAGDACWVVVCHLPMKEWRLVPLAVFTRTPRPPSWDVAEEQTYPTAAAALESLFGEKQ